MNNQITTAQRTKVINDIIADIDDRIGRIMDMSDDGFVCMFDTDGSCVDTETSTHRHPMSAGCVTRATVYTQDQFDACERYGVGIPAYRNGNGEFAKLVPVRDAKWRQLRDANDAITQLTNLIA